MVCGLVNYSDQYRFALPGLRHLWFFYGNIDESCMQHFHKRLMYKGDEVESDCAYQLLLF